MKLKDFKPGDLVKAWDSDKDYFSIGYFVQYRTNRDTEYLYGISFVQNNPDSGRSPDTYYANAEKVALVAMPDGVDIGDKCYFYDDDGSGARSDTDYLSDITAEGKFIDTFGTIWECCEKIVNKTYVRKFSQIAAWLEENNWKPDEYGNFWNPSYTDCFASDMFQYCGQELTENLTDEFDFRNEWLITKDLVNSSKLVKILSNDGEYKEAEIKCGGYKESV